MKKILLFLSVLILMLAVSCGSAPQYEETISGEIIYKRADGEKLGMEILYPTNRFTKKNPTVIALHGGGWISGTRDTIYSEFEPLCEKLRANGVTVVLVSYRLATDGRGIDSCMIDCEDALAFLIENADEYDIDTENIGIFGYSAGAHLALMTAINTRNAIKYCVSMSAPTYISKLADKAFYSPALEYYFGEIFNGDSDIEMMRASPIVNIGRKCKSSFLIINGELDSVVPRVHAERFYKEAISLGIDAELYIPSGLTHSYLAWTGYYPFCEEIADKIITALSN